ncbi:MAG TPA: glycine--tRNA ligase subunit beta [Terriglobales bacterium]|nr:glycine--tRNA ligase subunit beta [Terriglobales bacterium]
MPDFLLEIGCEEIPARMIDGAALDLRERVAKLLEGERLASHPSISHLESPRRLAVLARGISPAQPDITEQITGPPVSTAFQNGQPTPAAYAFARKAGVDLESLERVATAKGERLAARVTQRGRTASEVLSDLLPKQIQAVAWPKAMYWRRPGEVFVRPVRWLVAMLDRDVIPMELDGIRAGNVSRGHRILADGPVEIRAAGEDYRKALEAAKVLGREARQAQVTKAFAALTHTIDGARWREDPPLLDTVVNLTEWPAAILGSFDREFLKLPEEILVTVMRDHQKYFAVEDARGRLLPHFLAVLNTDGDPAGIIRHGHERVLRARFNDARFFWQTDQKHPLRQRTPWLKNVTFQKDLGSYYEKTLRIQRLSSWLCEIIRQSGMAVRPGIVHKAAYLAKTDLTTELVKEFTELQGIVGGLYAGIQELDTGMRKETQELIAETIYDQYKPQSMEDSVPRSVEGAVLALADKVDTIAGMFALGVEPTGSKDPFALRRHANGIVKILAEHKLPVRLSQLTEDAREAYRGSNAERKFSTAVDAAAKLRAFFRERLQFYLTDRLGYKYDIVNAALAADADDVVDSIARAEAVAKVRPSPDFESISIAFKRIKNILRQAEAAGKKTAAALDPSLIEEVAERELASRIPQVAERVAGLRQGKNYEQALTEISKLRPAVDAFFDKVMVMVEDDRIRANRLALLATLLGEFSTIADFSEIVTEREETQPS